MYNFYQIKFDKHDVQYCDMFSQNIDTYYCTQIITQFFAIL